jgi:SAM-dependent methyltransferase
MIERSLAVLVLLAALGCTHHQHLDDPGRDAWQRPAEVIAAMAPLEGLVVADVGAGTGYFEPHLSRAVGPGGKVLALELDPDLIPLMKRRFEEVGLSNVETRLVAADDPRLAPTSVDRVLIVDVWHHLTDRVAYATRLRQALTPGGQLVIVDRSSHVRPETVLEELGAAGMSARIVPDELPRQFIVVAR